MRDKSEGGIGTRSDEVEGNGGCDIKSRPCLWLPRRPITTSIPASIRIRPNGVKFYHQDLGEVLGNFRPTTVVMPSNNAAADAVDNEKGTTEHLDDKHDNDLPKTVPVAEVHDEKSTGFATDINHVAQLGLENTALLEKKVVRALDTWMMPQLWILYMFNYLNRTNIAQARLNTFDQDLNLGEGDYQVRSAGDPTS